MIEFHPDRTVRDGDQAVERAFFYRETIGELAAFARLFRGPDVTWPAACVLGFDGVLDATELRDAIAGLGEAEAERLYLEIRG